MAVKSEDIRKLNSIHLLKKLYELKNATMLELIEATDFSQSSVRSLLKDLEGKEILALETVDQSTGGRCPGRYTFVKNMFSVLSIFNDERKISIVFKDIFENVLINIQIDCDFDDERLEKRILEITQSHHVNCISIGSSGVVEGLNFYTDQGEYMTCHDLAVRLQEVLDIPVIIENDVKCMMMGAMAQHHYNHFAYLYMSQTGVGSAYYTNEHISRGHHSFSGELGLIPYLGKTINQVIASHPTSEVLEDIYIQLLTIIAVTIDPEKIMISGKNLENLSIDKMKTKLQEYLSLRYQLDIEISHDSLNDGMNGLHYLGILKLFDLYTNYTRSKRNG